VSLCNPPVTTPTLFPWHRAGVVSSHTLTDDLLQWRSLYVSGRMHKPVRVISGPSGGHTSHGVLAAARENLRHALRTALLLLPATFTAEQLYMVRVPLQLDSASCRSVDVLAEPPVYLG
jgi:hypothetical protein